MKWPFWFLSIALLIGCGGDKTASDVTPAGLPSEEPKPQAAGATPHDEQVNAVVSIGLFVVGTLDLLI